MEMNIIETINRFPDQSSCIAYLEGLRWQNEPECPYCNSKRSSKRHETYRHQCHGCNRSYSVLVGTIFESTKLPLTQWFLAISLILNAKKGLSARQLSRDLGVNRKTGWYLQMRIRKAMQEGEDVSLFKGIVEIDETYIGGKKANHSKKKRQARRDNKLQITGYQDKQPVIGLLERDGRIRLQVVDKAHGVTIKPIIEKTVSKDATIVTDGFGGYAGLSKIFREHQVLNKDKEQYARGKYHTNTIEGFWTLLKRGIYGQYHKISARYLQSYLDEFTFKYNHRDNRLIFDVLINKIAAVT
ncbi:IS1595 family transposase [Mucilaginibacter sp. RS28]|uniref:IS1595 family transposase n=2 Tax=Mucilaginibacter straminoryzae TaxID=2932774 RepID=A0A9X2BAP7_9SPHI|nr:IS1595 family transposase [Mucilaginibacter straminoryzae]